MLKKVFIFLAVLGLLAVLALVALGFFIGPAITKSVNTIGPKITGTKVELAATDVSLLSGGVALNGLFVGNPAGWQSDKAFYLGTVSVKLVPSSLLSDCIIINEVTIQSPEFVYETNLRSSNIAALQKQIQDNLAGYITTDKKADKTSDKTDPSPKFILKNFRLEGGKVTVGLGQSAISVTMPPVTISNLGVAEGGITADEVSGIILKTVLSNVSTAAANAILNNGGVGVEDVKSSLKNLLGK